MLADLRAGTAPAADPADPVWHAALRAAAAAVRTAGGATTLVVAVVDGAGAGVAARIGDSTAFVLRDGAWIELWPSAPVDDGPVTTATAALPGPDGTDLRPEVATVVLDAGDGLLLVTDGVANPLRDGPTTVAPALASALAAPPSPLGLAVVTDFSRQGCFDDRTILGLWTRSAPTDAGDLPEPA